VLSNLPWPATSSLTPGLVVPIPTFPVPLGISNMFPLPPPVDIVKLPVELVIVEAVPPTSNLAPGVAVPIPTFPLFKIVNNLFE